MAESFEQALERERRLQARPKPVRATVHVGVDPARDASVVVPVVIERRPDGLLQRIA